MISDLNQNLPALLQSAHISNPVLSARVNAAVNLLLTTVSSFAVLMLQNSAAPSNVTAWSLPQPKDLKRQWNQQV